MKNYKVNIDKPKPTQEEILSGRNFDTLLQQYNAAPGKVIKKPFWQGAGFIGSVAAVAATVAIVLMVMSNNNPATNEPQAPVIVEDNSSNPGVNTPDNIAWAPTKRKIAPPLAGVNVPFQQYKVSSKWGGQISYPTGTKITFQPNSFVDKNGQPVNGNVEVQYREMHDAVDFFLAGVPMEYDSAGATYVLESAGMIEVAAFINGQVVYLDKNKPVEVQMASQQGGTGYNLYEFDTVAGNWSHIGKDKVSAMPVAIDSVVTVVAMNNNTPQRVCAYVDNVPQEPVEPKKPLKADAGKNRFVVDFNKTEFPEMANYENVIFEVDETKEKFDAANYNVTWDMIKLSRGDNESKYKLTLKKGMKQVNLDVYPVLDGDDYKFAMADYDAKLALYEKQKVEYLAWKDAKARGIDLVAPGQNGGNDGGVARNGNTWVYTSGGNAKDSEMALDVMRTFSLSNFGLYNMDVASMLPQGSVLEMAMYGPDGQMFKDFTTLNHVDRNMNTVMTYHNQNPMSDFHVNTRSSNLIWAVKDGELYYADNDAFSALPLSGKVVLALKKVGKPLKSAEQMRAFFGLKAPDNAK